MVRRPIGVDPGRHLAVKGVMDGLVGRVVGKVLPVLHREHPNLATAAQHRVRPGAAGGCGGIRGGAEGGQGRNRGQGRDDR